MQCVIVFCFLLNPSAWKFLIRNSGRSVFSLSLHVGQNLHRHSDVPGTASCQCHAGIEEMGQVTETNKDKGTLGCPIDPFEGEKRRIMVGCELNMLEISAR